jgi:hypothetical protein
MATPMKPISVQTPPRIKQVSSENDTPHLSIFGSMNNRLTIKVAIVINDGFRKSLETKTKIQLSSKIR